MLKDSDEDNFLKVPPAVHPAVSAAQLLALVVAVISQDDVISTLSLVSVGYDSRRPGIPLAASRTKWIFSNVCRFSIGLASLFISFLFAVQSETVLDIFKDFAAMAFVSDIDDAAFGLAKRGFISSALEDATRNLEDVTFYQREDTVGFSADRLNEALPAIPGSGAIPGSDLVSSIEKSSICSMKVKSRLRRLLLISLLGIMVAMWGYTYSKQQNGDYISKSLSVRFGDEYWGALQYAYFSGTYEFGLNDNGGTESIEYRPVYYERGPLSEQLSGKFFYCLEEKAWVFSISGISKGENDEGCLWLLRSPETESFDLSDVSTEGWSIWTGNIEYSNSLHIKEIVCNSNADCNYHGSCNGNNGCVCEEGWRGESCQLEEFCEVVQLYEKDKTLVEFNLLRDDSDEPILVYDRPAYYHQGNGVVSVFLYTGRRWFYIVEWELLDLISQMTVPFFHAYWEEIYDKGNLEAYSEPTESSTPAGIHWYVVSGTRSIGDYGPFGFSRKIMDATVHCKAVDCNESNRVCGLFGECFEDGGEGKCICQEGLSTGHFCEYFSSNATFFG